MRAIGNSVAFVATLGLLLSLCAAEEGEYPVVVKCVSGSYAVSSVEAIARHASPVTKRRSVLWIGAYSVSLRGRTTAINQYSKGM